MDFREVDRRYADLKRQYDAGTLSAEAFDGQLRDLMIQDDQGRWWAKSRDGGQWSYHDGTTWQRSTPPYPAEQPATAATVIAPPSAFQQGGQAGAPLERPVTPASASPGGAASYSTPAPVMAAPGSGEITSTMALIYYAVSFLFFAPIIGVILFAMNKDKPSESDRKVARNSLYAGLAGFLLTCGCSVCYLAMVFSFSG